MPSGREERKEGMRREECRRREGKTGKDGEVGMRLWDFQMKTGRFNVNFQRGMGIEVWWPEGVAHPTWGETPKTCSLRSHTTSH